MARQNREHDNGIGRLWHLDRVPDSLRDYLATVRTFNSTNRLRYYPGSPGLVRRFLRPQDRMVLCELHSSEIRNLRQAFAGDHRVGVHHLDGYQGLQAFLPPAERRGLVLCDPAYERKDERQRLIAAIETAWKRWPTGIYAVWHPLQERQATERFYRQFQRLDIGPLLRVELSLLPEDVPNRLNGSGLILINPPWQLDIQLAEMLPWLWSVLGDGTQGGWRLE